MKYYIWALGCAMNHSDAERIASVFEDAGHTQTTSESDADFVVIVACSVRQHAIDRIYGKAREWQKRKENGGLVTILSGCVLDKDRVTMSKFFDLIFDIKDLPKLRKFLESSTKSKSLNPKQYQNPKKANPEKTDLEIENWDSIENCELEIENYEDYFSITPKRESSFSAYVPISTGCNNFCTYCAVPYTRGREVSRPMPEILSEIRNLVSAGYKEITLLGQNVNSYGSDFVHTHNYQGQKDKRTEKQKNNVCSNPEETKDLSKKNEEEKRFFDSSLCEVAQNDNVGSDSQCKTLNTDFTKLLKKIDKIPGTYRVYFYSNHPKDFSDELIKAIPKTEHFPHYIHLPLQSGSDKILKAMNRHYTQKNYFSLVNKIKKAIPEVAITTDVIVGFPGETEEDFNETKKVVRDVGFEMIYIGKFSPRSGTRAAKMEDNVPQKVKEKRWQEITNLLKKYLEKENKKYVGMIMKVLIDSEKNGKYYGRTDNYKIVELQNEVQPHVRLNLGKQTSLLGQFVDVEIVSSEAWMLKGRVV